VFWDADIFVVPYLTMTQPDLARAHLGYRYRGLDGARRKAARYGRAGAFFAWESAGTGDEVTPDWGETADGERIRIRTGEIEEHIVADVAYALDHYVRWTDDDDFLRDEGAEMSLDGARYWQERAEVEREGRAHLRNVIGPDEYHVGVDDNFFTNAMAAWHLRAAVRHANGVDDLVSRLGLPEGWEEAFHTLAGALEPIPGPDHRFEQHDGYFDLDQVDLARFEPRGAPLHAIFGEKRLERSQITKQADVVMGLVLLDALQTRELIEANLDYYGPRTDHGSSLSLAMHSLAASMAQRPDQAYDYFRRAAAIDLQDSMHNAGHGIHAATQGGLLQAALIGFGGLHLTEDGPQTIARLPDHWDSLGFSFVHRGTRHEREVRGGKPARGAEAPRADHDGGG
jgi:kojibiose phosphorylase